MRQAKSLLKNPDGEMAVMALTMRAKQPKRRRGGKAKKGIYRKSMIIQERQRQRSLYRKWKDRSDRGRRAAKAPQYEVADMQDYDGYD